MVMILFVFYLSTEVLRVSSSSWLSFWTDQSTTEGYRPGFYIFVYALLSLGQVCLLLVYIMIFICSYAFQPYA